MYFLYGTVDPFFSYYGISGIGSSNGYIDLVELSFYVSLFLNVPDRMSLRFFLA